MATLSSPGAPVRPPARLLRALIHAWALPGVGTIGIAGMLKSRDDGAAALEQLIRQVRGQRSPREVERARGWAERALETIHREGVHVLLPGMPAYPGRLDRLAHPPCPLFAQGRLQLLDTTIVAVVGTRRCTAYGRESAHRIAWGLAAAGVTVISGLARGIDGVAHRAAGASRTVAVVGSGLDVFFPREHQALQRAIAREGLLLGEQLPGTPPAGHNFPRRNRIIAALAEAAVVVEAPTQSGALSTASKARELGAHVFAVPGPISVPQSRGTNDLIRDGGTLVTSAREVLTRLGLPLPPVETEEEVPPEELEGQGLALWRALGAAPRHIDEISEEVGLAPHLSLASLLALEVRGHARQLPGMCFVRG